MSDEAKEASSSNFLTLAEQLVKTLKKFYLKGPLKRRIELIEKLFNELKEQTASDPLRTERLLTQVVLDLAFAIRDPVKDEKQSSSNLQNTNSKDIDNATILLCFETVSESNHPLRAMQGVYNLALHYYFLYRNFYNNSSDQQKNSSLAIKHFTRIITGYQAALKSCAENNDKITLKNIFTETYVILRTEMRAPSVIELAKEFNVNKIEVKAPTLRHYQ